MKKVVLNIEGMTCSACSNGLEKYVKKQKGVFNAYVNLVLATLNVEYDDTLLDITDIEQLVQNAGFKSLGEFKKISLETQKNNKKLKLVFGALVLVSLILCSTVLHFETKIQTLFSFVLSTYFLIDGRDIIKSGLKNMLHLMPNMDTLVMLGTLTCYSYSLYHAYLILSDLVLTAPLYFESGAMIIYFIKLGRYIENLNQNKTRQAISKLVTITPDFALKLQNKTETKVTIDEIQKGDILVSYAGDKIAADGIIVDGSAHFDESFITGESKTKKKQVGDHVLAGAFNYDGYIHYQALKIGKQSSVSEIVQLVLEASATKPRMAQFADKVSGIFVPSIILLALLTFAYTLFSEQQFHLAIVKFVTILVCACPCALGLATPLALITGEGIALQNGILIKKSSILENASKINAIVFDKTGTLTEGKLKIDKIFNFSQYSDKQLCELASILEAQSKHPIANAFKTSVLSHNMPISHFENLSGLGIKAKIDNHDVLLGNQKLLEKYKIKLSKNHFYKTKENDYTPVYMAVDGKFEALFCLKDVLKENANIVVKWLEKNHISVWMLTGDNALTANLIAKAVGIKHVLADVLPSQKVLQINFLKKCGYCVMMVGDGINDSPSLSAANIGLSMNSGTEIAMDSSDVILQNNNLINILKLLEISRQTVKIIKQNLFWAFFYNILMLPIAMGALSGFGIEMSPHIAALAMIFSSLFVVFNTLRLKKIHLFHTV